MSVRRRGGSPPGNGQVSRWRRSRRGATAHDQGLAAALRDRDVGFEVPSPPSYFGSVQALEVDHDRGEVSGALDP